MVKTTKIGTGLGSCILALCSGCTGLRSTSDQEWHVGLNITPNELGGCFVTFDIGESRNIDDKDIQVSPVGGG